MVVRELLTRLGFSVDNSQLNKYERGVTNIKNSANEAANSFKQMFVAFASFGALKSIARIADEMQSMQARIGMLPQTVGDAASAFDTVAGRATAARQSIDAYGNLYVKLSNAGKKYIKTQEEGLQITDTLSKALVVGGATAQEQSSAMLQFAQAVGSGVFQGDEFRAMAEAAPQFMDEFSKAAGIPRENLKKLSSQGKLTAQMVIENVKKMSSVFDSKFKQMPMTLGQSITIINNRWDMFINRLNRSSGAVTLVSNAMLDAFDSVEAGLDSMTEFFGGATNALKFFAIAITAAVLPALVRLGAGMLAFLVTPAGLIFLALTAVGLAMEDFYVWMKGGDSVLGDIFGSSEAFKNSLIGLWGWIKSVGKAIDDAFDFGDIVKSSIRVLAGLQSMLVAVAKALKAIATIAISAFTLDASGMIEGSKQLLDAMGEFGRGAANVMYGGFDLAGGVAGGAYNLTPLGGAPGSKPPTQVTPKSVIPQTNGRMFTPLQHTLNVNVSGNTTPEILGGVKSGLQSNGTTDYFSRMVQIQGQ